MSNKNTLAGKVHGLTQSNEQAVFVFNHIFSNYPLETLLENGMAFLNQTPRRIRKAYKKLPEIEKRYPLAWLALPGNAQSKFPNGDSIQIAVAFELLFFIITNCWELFGQNIYAGVSVDWEFTEKEEFENLVLVSKHVPFQNIIESLQKALLQITGIEYYEKFLAEMDEADIQTEKEADDFSSKPEIACHSNLMVGLALYKCILDSAYFLVDQKKLVNDNTALN